MKRTLQTVAIALLCGCTAFALTPSTPSRSETMEQRLQRIVLPEVQFREAPLADVIEFLTHETIRLDPAKQGVNFVVLNPADKSPRLTMRLQQVPVREALKYIVEMSGLQLRLDRNAVVLFDPEAVKPAMETRIYPVSPATFETLVPEQDKRPQLRRPQ